DVAIRLEQQPREREEQAFASSEVHDKASPPQAQPVSAQKKSEPVVSPPQHSPAPDVSLAAENNVASADSHITTASSDEADPFAFLHHEGAFDFGVQPTFGRKSSDTPVPFTLDKSRSIVAYQHPDDVLEIYKSLNRTRVAREDNTTATCDAYVFTVRENGLPQVFIAFYLVDSQEIMIYAPEKQPVQEAELGTIMSDGFDFIEIVGFMMDPVDLGNDPAGRKKKLDKIPVLQRIAADGG
ncbi:MAG: hypothetical protein WCA04_14910, partial [Geobacteraceae bacterium]